MKESGTMKLKKWLSRALVLAMVVALMIPVPVAAKSSGGGKLVKSVTYYSPVKTGGWQAETKVSYKYGKKAMPTEITTTNYYSYFLGVPVSGSSNTTAIKYKGKSAKLYDSAGFLFAKRSYKGGKLVSYSSDNKTTSRALKADGKTVYDLTKFSATVGHESYFKNGLAKASDYTSSYLDSDNKSWAYTENTVYAWTQKKGVPSAVVTTSVKTGKDDRQTFDGKAESEYAIFNSKGFAVEIGKVNKEGKNVPDYAIQYTMKKGKVASAVVYEIDSKGVPTPVSMVKFAYTNKSISKTKNFNMINSLVDRAYGEGIDSEYEEVYEYSTSVGIPGGFSWY